MAGAGVVVTRWRDRALVGALGVAVAAAIAAVGVVLAAPPGSGTEDEAMIVSGMVEERVGRAPATSTTLPTPEPPPDNPRAPTPVVEVGSIAVPKIGLDAPMREGVTLTIIDLGPAHWPGSAMPGERGNVVVAGHRTIRSRPFRDLDLLAAGDEIVLRSPAGVFTYAVSEKLIVDPHALWIIEPSPEPTVTLFACHPKGSARQRIVVKGRLTASSTE